MLATNIRRRWHRRISRWGTLGLALLFTLTTVGISLPMPLLDEHASAEGPYPCQGHACGCRTARDCWSRCCCHSRNERIVWAQARGITPPAELLALADKPFSHCSANCGQASTPARACCVRGDASRDDASKRGREVLLAQWFGCRGLTPAWHALGAGDLLPSAPEPRGGTPPARDWVARLDFWTPPCLDRLDPPPEGRLSTGNTCCS